MRTLNLDGSRGPVKKKDKKRLWLLLVFAVVVAGIVYAFCRVHNFVSATGLQINVGGMVNAIIGKNIEIKKDEDGYTNVLLVGIDTRPTGEFSNTDTIIVASYNENTQNISMISIPRDTIVQYPDRTTYYAKINSIYMHAEQIEEGTGLKYLADCVSNYLGIEIHYGVMVNLRAFVEIIDAISGVDVNVERSFTDYAFPTYSGGWEVISFEEGLQHMDGETALKYARSRHAAGIEGSDFARSRRQQNLLKAIKDKVINDPSIINISTINNVLQSLEKNITLYNVSDRDIRAFVDLAAQYASSIKVYGIVMDPLVANGQLIAVGNQGILNGYAIAPVPYDDYEKMHEFIKYFLENPELISSNPVIYIYGVGSTYSNAYELLIDLQSMYPYTRFIFGGYYKDNEDILEGINISYTDDYQDVAAIISQYLEKVNTCKINPSINAIYGESITIVVK